MTLPTVFLDALATVFLGLPVKPTSPQQIPLVAIGEEPESTVGAGLGPYHARIVGGTIFVVQVDDEGVDLGSVSERLTHAIFPLYAALAFASSGQYHRLIGRSGWWGHRRLTWRLEVESSALGALQPGPEKNGSAHPSSHVIRGKTFTEVRLSARGHDLTRYRGRPRKIVSGLTSALLGETGNDPHAFSMAEFLDALEQIRVGPTHTAAPMDGRR
jgi:hypothetical protein